MRSPLILGTRGSPLALWQAHHVQALVERGWPVEVRLETIRTTGDKITEVPLAQAGGSKTLFTKEIEEELLERRVDLAVHSLKDLPVALPAGLALAAVLAREDARDALISRHGESLDKLASGARVGTSSLRRQLQLHRLRPDLTIEPLRGNLDTRLRKLDDDRYDAIVVAYAGLKRMGWADRATLVFSPEEFVPAIGQGALALETRADDAELLAGLRRLADPDTEAATEAERAFLARLGGGCQVPLAAHAVVRGERLRLTGVVINLDATHAVRGTEEGAVGDAHALGTSLAEKLLREGAREILATIEAAAARPPGAA
jgi:hydroxymethylbilane synthase